MSPKFVVSIQNDGFCFLDERFYEQLYTVDVELPMSCPVKVAGVRNIRLSQIHALLTANGG